MLTTSEHIVTSIDENLAAIRSEIEVLEAARSALVGSAPVAKASTTPVKTEHKHRAKGKAEKVLKLLAEGHKPMAVAKKLHVTPAYVYTLRKQEVTDVK